MNLNAQTQTTNYFLLFAGVCTAIAAVAHIGCIIFGAPWYRFFGAGEEMATMAEQGLIYPHIVTAVIATILLLWPCYAFSGAKRIRQIPMLKIALCVISAIFLIRGIGFVFIMPTIPDNSMTFWLVSSSICLVIGGAYALGTKKAWSQI